MPKKPSPKSAPKTDAPKVDDTAADFSGSTLFDWPLEQSKHRWYCFRWSHLSDNKLQTLLNLAHAYGLELRFTFVIPGSSDCMTFWWGSLDEDQDNRLRTT